MDDCTIDNFICAMLRFRKMTTGLPCQSDVQMLELTVLERVIGDFGCPCENLNVAEIQETLHVSKPAVSQTLNTLEKKGYLTRQIHPQDRRRVAVLATPEGRQALESSKSAFDRTMDEVISRFGRDDMLELVAYLNRLSDVYEQLRREMICGGE